MRKPQSEICKMCGARVSWIKIKTGQQMMYKPFDAASGNLHINCIPNFRIFSRPEVMALRSKIGPKPLGWNGSVFW